MKNLFLIFMCIVACCCLILGCSNDSIKFQRESKFSEVMKSIQLPSSQPKVKKSSGVVIYRDEQQQKTPSSNSGFGPSDINFDLKVKF